MPPAWLRSITGGNDKQGFPMAQGILTNSRVRLLMAKGAIHYRPRRAGERKRKSVRGCIVGPDLATLNLVIAKKGAADIAGLTTAESERPRRLGPKRAQKIRKLFRLSKEDDVRKFVVTRHYKSRKGEKKEHQKRPKIQRLVTSLTLQHKRQRIGEKKKSIERQKKEKSQYKAIVSQRNKESRDARASLKARRQSSRRSSKKEAA
jgi:small subunit ribosomal protein S6e